ncbi:MAG: tetratricopeptide repeat protein [Fibrobacterota bacterium]
MGVIIFLLVFSAAACADCGDSKFADMLYSSGEYDKAALEYLRLIYECPDEDRAPLWKKTAGLCRYNTGDYNKALRFFRELAPEDSASALLAARSSLKLGLTDSARALLKGRSDPDGILLLSRSYFEENNYDKAAEILKDVARGTGTPAELRMRSAGQYLDSLISFEPKSYACAGLLSIVPGLGHFYTGNNGDGFFSAVVTGIFAGMTVYYYHFGSEVRAYFTGAVAGGFYFGSIYGAIMGVKKYNRSEKAYFRTKASAFYED